MKRHFWLFVLLLTASSALAAEEFFLDGVAAIVNSNVITHSQVHEFVQPVLMQLRREYTGKELDEKIRIAKQDALNNLIDRTLIIEEFNTKGYMIPDNLIEQQINDTIANDYGGDRTSFTKTLQAQKLTFPQYREKVRERTIIQAMRSKKSQHEIVISPNRIEQYYKTHLADYKLEDQVKLRMIFIKKSADPDVPTASRRAFGESLLTKLDNGTNFADLAKQHSEDADAKKGGERDWITRDTIQKQLNDAAFGLKPGQHSKLIETKEGFYIIQVDDFRAAHTKPLSEVRDTIEKVLAEEQRARMHENWVRELRSKAFIRIFEIRFRNS
jgi:peptidyl-prolyl cis-trans isomerase SurA